MRRALRTTGVMLPALLVIAWAWLRLEQPIAPPWRPLVLLALALGAAAPRRRRLRLLAAVIAALLAARIVFGVDLLPWHAADGFPTVGTRFGNGFSDFYSTHLPFDPRLHAAMGELVLAALFGFSLAAALLAAERKPIAAAAAVLVGAGWPGTLLGPSHGIAMGAAILAAALVVLAGLGSRRVPALALPATALVAAGAIAVGSATAARHGLVHWQSWNLAGRTTGSVRVGFVWDVRYGGLSWPRRPSVVLEIKSNRRPSYLRAAVLDDFVGDRWAIGLPRASDFLEPPAAGRPGNQTREFVTVAALADRHLVGGSIPIRFAAGGAPLTVAAGGIASRHQDLPRGFQYTVWSYAPKATAAQLRRSPPDYPPALARDDFFDVGRGVAMPAFGTQDRAGSVHSLLTVNPDLYQYRPLALLAEQLAGRARTPYDAVARLEKWFVASGNFRYSNHPPVIAPPLVNFVTRTRAGYCQYFAGAMALMLRYLGIPSRVAVGFAGSAYSASRRAWLVTDTEAHAWVEVWFEGYGWVPFDPTPPAPGSARVPTLPGTSTPVGGGKPPATPIFHDPAGSGGTSAVAGKLSRQNGLGGRRAHGGSRVPPASPGGGGRSRALPFLLLLLVLAAAGGGIVVAKAGIRLRRRVHRDARRVAAACREELEAFLVDQRIDVPQSATLRELGELVQDTLGVRSAAFVDAATAARFAPDAQAGAGAATARRELRALLGEVRRSLTRGERLRGLFSLRSLARPAVAVDASASLESGIA